MFHGQVEMIVEKRELIHAVDCYFYAHVRDNGLDPCATVLDVCERDDGKYIIALQGVPGDG